ncbi:MAG TPA: DUF1343 domain-containing protein [Thermomicrobiales bacterium]|jgi:uncharacterized protein YbbC (DUF1343 family)
MAVLTGAEQLRAEQFARLRGKRVGLLTNPTGVTADLTSLVDLLGTAQGVTLAALFGPEHGLLAGAAAGEEVGEATHPRFGVPIHSLYGSRQAPTPESLTGLDVLVIDLQDIGARFFTYLATVALTLEVCGQTGTPVLILDRPNPIDGEVIEGPIVEPDLSSFVGQLPIPIRHGLTLGELAHFANDTEGFGAPLEVLPVQGWRRSMRHAATGLPWVLPSPNVPTIHTADVYTGTCLIEAPNLSEGRGTTLPFELIGAPWLDGERLAADLNALDLPGVRWRPVAFTPSSTSRDHIGIPCFGVQIHPTDLVALRTIPAALHLMTLARAQDVGAFSWREPWAVGSERPVELLSGTRSFAAAIDAAVPVAEIIAGWEPALAQFREDRRPYLLYE